MFSRFPIRSGARRRGAAGRTITAGVLLMALGTAGCGGDTPDPAAASSSGSSSAAAGGSPAWWTGQVIPAAFFGMHVGLLGNANPPVPPKAGSIRLWDSGVTWRDLQPTKAEPDWTALDTAVQRAEQMGAQDITWVHGSTPQWAALDPKAKGIYGPGSSSAPKEKPYLDFLRLVAERYKGRIHSYQVWNEANIKIFYRGDPEYLAQLTSKSKDILAEVDPQAKLVGASTTVRAKGPVKSFYQQYSAELAKLQWPLDAMAVHLYPTAAEGPQTRAEYLRLIRAWLAERGWTGPLWDTEINYGDRRDFAKEVVVVPNSVAAGYVARTYLDSLALGVDRVFWYTWNDHLLGIDMIDPATSQILPAGQAYLTVQDWLSGATWQGCQGQIIEPADQSGLSTCTAQLADGKPASIMWTSQGEQTIDTPQGATEMCRLSGACKPVSTVAKVVITPEPVLFKLT